MAVTKIWPIKKWRSGSVIDYISKESKTLNPNYGTIDPALDQVLDYATDDLKTEKHFFTTALNCDLLYAKEEFTLIKESWGKTEGRVAYHAYQSFAPGETNPETAHKIGVQLAKELWGSRFQVVIATHLNTDCLHNHFVINSVSFKDGLKFHHGAKDLRKLRAVSDRLCKEYGLSVVPEKTKEERRKEREAAVPGNMVRATKAGRSTRLTFAKEAVDEALQKSWDLPSFQKALLSLGYKARTDPNRKYWTLTERPVNGKKPRTIRVEKWFGEAYSLASIIEKLKANEQSGIVFRDFHKGQKQKRKTYLLMTRRDKIKKVTGLKGLYLRYCYALGYLPKYRFNPNRVPFDLKDDLLKIERLSKQARLLYDNHVESTDDLKALIDRMQTEYNTLIAERVELRKAVRRVMPEDEKAAVKSRLNAKTVRIKKVREEIRLAKDVEATSDHVAEKLLMAEQDATLQSREEDKSPEQDSEKAKGE